MANEGCCGGYSCGCVRSGGRGRRKDGPSGSPTTGSNDLFKPVGSLERELLDEDS